MSDTEGIVAKIKNALTLLAKSNKQPTMLYLGCCEIYDLMCESEYNRNMKKKSDIESFLGIKITRVNKNSHFDIGFISGNNHYKPIVLNKGTIEQFNNIDNRNKLIRDLFFVHEKHLGKRE